MWPCIVTNFFILKPNRDQDGTAVQSCSCSKAVYKLVWHTPLLSVQWINSWWWTDELSETCRVSCQNKFEKLVHLIGFNIKKREIYIDKLQLWTCIKLYTGTIVFFFFWTCPSCNISGASSASIFRQETPNLLDPLDRAFLSHCLPLKLAMVDKHLRTELVRGDNRKILRRNYGTSTRLKE
jgi:hypothetical protein